MDYNYKFYISSCEPLQKKRRLNESSKYTNAHKRKCFDSKIDSEKQLLKKQKLTNYWHGRTEPINKYDLLIISSMTNCIHRYIV
jgi:hypothetical protein